MKLFGTDGIRSRAGEFPLNGATISAVGTALGERLRGRVLIARDTRISGSWIFDLLVDGILRVGGTAVENAGILPTPAVALLTRKYEFSGGIMISASHNPFDDNGIKVFSGAGLKLADDEEAELERRVEELLSAHSQEARDVLPELYGGAPPTVWAARYMDALAENFRPGPWLKGMSVVLDCANGAMSSVAPELLAHLGAKVRAIHTAPTGRNINENCGALHLHSLCRTVQEERADFGVAFDGDGDRSLFASSSGREVNGDAVLLVLARRLKPGRVVGTSMTNYALERKLRDESIELVRVGVGDRNIFEEMKRSPDSIGGEPSGHIILPDFGLSGDGLLTAVKLADVLVESQRTMDDLVADWVPAPHLLEGVRVERRLPIEQMPVLQREMKLASAALRERGRLVVRYSGTEPLLRLMIESDSPELNREWMRRLLESVEEDFSSI